MTLKAKRGGRPSPISRCLYSMIFAMPGGSAIPNLYFEGTQIATYRDAALYMRNNFYEGGGWFSGSSELFLWCFSDTAPTFVIYDSDGITPVPGASWAAILPADCDTPLKCYRSELITVPDIMDVYVYTIENARMDTELFEPVGNVIPFTAALNDVLSYAFGSGCTATFTVNALDNNFSFVINNSRFPLTGASFYDSAMTFYGAPLSEIPCP